MRCLLDSGCERSVINADLVPNAKLTPLQYSLYAANKASLDVVGDSVISFVIDGQHFEAVVSVLAKVDEFLLGSDWLENKGLSGTSPTELCVLRCTVGIDGDEHLSSHCCSS